MKKESLDDELKELSPWLRDIKRPDDGFRVPEGYFGALEESVLSRVDATGMRRKAVLEARRGDLFARLIRSRYTWVAAAVMVAVLAATWLFKINTSQQEAISDVANRELTEEEIENYVLDNIRDFDAELLADVPAGELAPPETRTVQPAEAKPASDPLDDLSDEELDLLLKEMSDEELESLIKT